VSEADVRLRSRRFREERETDWRRLEDLLDRATKKSARALTEEELTDLPRAYRSTLSALGVTLSTSLDKDALDYLESLATRAYFFMYGSRSTLFERLSSFFRRDWPKAVRDLWRETLVAALVTIAGAVAAHTLVGADPDWFYSFVPAELASGRTPAAATETLRGTLYDNEDQGGLSVFATFLFTHNARVALFAFALGFAFCAPTIFLLAWNGCVLGAFWALYADRGLGLEFGGWLSIHGVTELFAIALAGAAGVRVGWAIAHPGGKTRLAAAAEASRTAGLALGGVVVMLFFAGLLEGFGRQLINSDAGRYGVALASGAVWLSYFYLGGLRERADGARR
jgi:uncharacterized membrane protein SpoIIM required for sporulation